MSRRAESHILTDIYISVYDACMDECKDQVGCSVVGLLVPVPALTPAQQERAIRVFRALGDSTRLEVFQWIAAQSEPVCVCDITSQFDVSQPTISHHLKVLREAGLVTVSRRGVWAYYSPRREALDLVRTLLDSVTPRSLAATG